VLCRVPYIRKSAPRRIRERYTVSSRIILENNEGRTGMGFDASEVMRELDGQRVMREVDAQRVLRDSSHGASVSNDLRQYKQLARDLNGMDWMRRSIQGSMVPAIGDVWAAEMSLSNYARMQSDMLGYCGLRRSIAQAFESHGIDSANIAAWSLRRVQSIRTSALPPILKAATTFGPIVVSPDYKDDAPFDYHPDLGWRLPGTATESGDAIYLEGPWPQVVAFAQGIAVRHCTEALLSVMGNGSRVLIRVSKHPVTAAIVGSAAGGVVSGDVVAAAVSGGISSGITYLLTRR
jgi:hypothetical protein